jgi:hypothetical protein
VIYHVTVERLTGETFQIHFGGSKFPFQIGEVVLFGGDKIKAEVVKKPNGDIYFIEINQTPTIYKIYRFDIFGANIFYLYSVHNAGWIRFFGSKGIKWKHVSEQLLFSERIGKTPLYRIGKWNIGFLK